MTSGKGKEQKRQLGLFTAIAIVVANMIGTGIFTTTGFLAERLLHPGPILAAWVAGGVVALCGALAYAELAVAMPRSGGEYYYLSRLYHPVVGFLSGWISLIVGFSAPVAAAAVAFGEYLSAINESIPPLWAATGIVLLLSVLHLADVKWGSTVQNFFAALKFLLIAGLIVAGFALAPDLAAFPALSGAPLKPLLSPAFAVSLIFVMYTYSGWNAATYIAGEVRNPGRNLPRALIIGTLAVIVLYAGLNALFLFTLSVGDMAGEVEVGHFVAVKLFGQKGGQYISTLISIALVSSVSAMIMAGPRVYEALGEDHRFFAFLSKRSGRQTPWVAILLQMGVALLLVATFSFEAILYYVGFTLSLFSGLAVAGVYVLRQRKGGKAQGYKTWGYPVTPAVFILVSGWMVVHTLLEQPVESCIGLGTLALGGVIYWFTAQ